MTVIFFSFEKLKILSFIFTEKEKSEEKEEASPEEDDEGEERKAKDDL